MTHARRPFLLALVASTCLTATSALAEDGVVRLRLLGTSDLHASILAYDYYRDREDPSQGFARVASLIRLARQEAPNALFFDNGDTIQGNPLGDYVARERGLKAGEAHPIHAALAKLGVAAGALGNHEFNYGLDFLRRSLGGAQFPVLSANVFLADGDTDSSNDKPAFEPYRILPVKVKFESGGDTEIKVGVTSFVPPQIMAWDQANLAGKVTTRDIVASAKAIVPEIRAKGADIVVALAHTGLSFAPAAEMDENAGVALTTVPGIDAIITGHAHGVFPGPAFANQPGVDLAKGTINGVPVVMPGFWGSHLGVIDLTLKRDGAVWKVADTAAQVRPIAERKDGKLVATVASDPEVEAVAKTVHEETLAYIRKPVGEATAPINSFFALVQDDPSIQIVTNAQTWYVAKLLKGTAREGMPILSAGAPFKAGGRAGVENYTDVPAGPLAIKNAADLYLYPNTLRAVELTGAQVAEWLEMSAGAFNRIDPAKTEEQSLLNPDFPSYNYDVIDGVTYRIDVSKPARYGADGKLVAADSHRIVDLQYQGKPIDPAAKFVVVTNNYRAGGGGKFPGLDGTNIIIEAPDENRTVLINYIFEQKTINPSADGNWGFAPIGGNPVVTFPSTPKAQSILPKDGRIVYVGEAADGFAKYAVKFSK